MYAVAVLAIQVVIELLSKTVELSVFVMTVPLSVYAVVTETEVEAVLRVIEDALSLATTIVNNMSFTADSFKYSILEGILIAIKP